MEIQAILLWQKLWYNFLPFTDSFDFLLNLFLLEFPNKMCTIFVCNDFENLVYLQQNMKNLQSQLAPSTQDMGLNDIYAQVMGPDKNGRARMFGYETTVSQVYIDKPIPASIHHMSLSYKAKFEAMEE